MEQEYQKVEFFPDSNGIIEFKQDTTDISSTIGMAKAFVNRVNRGWFFGYPPETLLCAGFTSKCTERVGFFERRVQFRVCFANWHYMWLIPATPPGRVKSCLQYIRRLLTFSRQDLKLERIKIYEPADFTKIGLTVFDHVPADDG